MTRFTTEKKGKGSGLGLANVHRIVKNFGGTIKVVSRTHEGTQFDVLLPLSRLRKRQWTYPEVREDSNRGDERIWIVDDESPVAEFEAKALSLLGYSMTICTDSETALNCFHKTPMAFDLVITDLTMPGLTGIALATRMRGIRADIPVLLCTGFADSLISETTQATRLHSVLHKPLLPKELAAGVRQVLAAHTSLE